MFKFSFQYGGKEKKEKVRHCKSGLAIPN